MVFIPDLNGHDPAVAEGARGQAWSTTSSMEAGAEPRTKVWRGQQRGMSPVVWRQQRSCEQKRGEGAVCCAARAASCAPICPP